MVLSYMRKSKTIPVTGLWGPEGSGRLRLPDSVASTLEVKGFQPYAPVVFTPRSILLLTFKRLSRHWAHGIVGYHGKNPQ
jgi:hypothetical protein